MRKFLLGVIVILCSMSISIAQIRNVTESNLTQGYKLPEPIKKLVDEGKDITDKRLKPIKEKIERIKAAVENSSVNPIGTVETKISVEDAADVTYAVTLYISGDQDEAERSRKMFLKYSKDGDVKEYVVRINPVFGFSYFYPTNFNLPRAARKNLISEEQILIINQRGGIQQATKVGGDGTTFDDFSIAVADYKLTGKTMELGIGLGQNKPGELGVKLPPGFNGKKIRLTTSFEIDKPNTWLEFVLVRQDANGNREDIARTDKIVLRGTYSWRSEDNYFKVPNDKTKTYSLVARVGQGGHINLYNLLVTDE